MSLKIKVKTIDILIFLRVSSGDQ